MKNKSGRHKELNTFKFLPFSERIANIDIDVFHRVGHEYESQTEEDESLFYQAIIKWDVLNLTEQYSSFRKEVNANNLITLPQLIHEKDNVVQVLLKYLRCKDVLCLQPLLELVVALANDLRKDFYSYYPELLGVIIDLLNTKNPEILEWTFTCLAYLFKFLWRPLTKDINAVFITLLPLLSDTKPYYINNFAAESFAFVVRKIKDHSSFLTLLLKAVKNNSDSVNGCGKLLFEVIHGVNNQFHSCANALLPFLFESLSNEKLPQSILFEVLQEVVANVSTKIDPHKSEIFWSTIITILDKSSEEWKLQPSEKKERNIELILKLTGQAIEHKQGKFLHNPDALIPMVLKLLGLDLPETIFLVISQISVLLLLCRNVKLSQEQASSLTRKLLGVPKKILLHFVNNVTSYTSFEALILPAFLKHCSDSKLDNESLHVLAQIILKKSPPAFGGLSLETWNKYPLNLNSKELNNQICHILKDRIIIKDFTILLNDFDNYLCSLICLPHVIFENDTEIQELLKINLKLFCEEIKSTKDQQKMLFLLLNTLESASHILTLDNLKSCSDFLIDSVLNLCTDINLLTSIKILDLYLTSVKNDSSIITKELLKKLHNTLETNFNSPYHELRLSTTHIYSIFEGCLNQTEEFELFTLCQAVESISPQVQTYRDQIKNLEKLSYDKSQMQMIKDTDFNQIPLRYLCGVLYMNFQLLWDPTINIIVTHANGAPLSNFWSVFVKELKEVVEQIRNPVEFIEHQLESNCDFLDDLYKAVYCIEVKPDFKNRRLLLWKALALFPETAEAKTRDVSDLLLNFIEEEYMKSNSDIAVSWNIKENSSDNSTKEIGDENSDESFIKKELSKPALKSKGFSNVKTLQQILGVFAKVRSPKSMYREPELNKLYFDLLSHKNSDVQRLALDCLMTYKFKYLTPYQEHLYNLISEKNFKDELATFRVDTESTIVQDEHRDDLIPIVLKIVYSKMFIKTGLRTGGKASGQLRRNLILRFLAGCRGNEMLNFIQMAFRFYTKYFDNNLEYMINNISDNINLENFIPPKRLQSTLNLLQVVFERFGGLMGNDTISFLLRVLFVIGASLKGASEQIADVHAGYLQVLRNLRTASLKIIERFFEHFESYPWTAEEINAVFNVFVWPYLDKLTVEGIHSPTNLLKLFIQWGSNPRYFSLLVKHHNDDSEQYVLPHIMSLLLNKKSHPSVVNAIMEMYEKLLSLIPDEEDPNLKITTTDLLPIREDILERLKINDKLNYGSCILLPHVSQILQHIKRKLEAKSKSINQRDLFILSRISELVWESDLSDSVLSLLLPIVQKRCSAGEDTVLKYITSIANLLQNVEEPQKHFKQLSPLFGEVSHASSRKVLCEILERISIKSGDTKLKAMYELVLQLNAWDAKWVDQPDYQQRLMAFKTIKNLIETDSLDLTLGVIVIFNCSHMINKENDLSLRENAADCWKSVSVALLKKGDPNYLLNDILFNLIKKGFKSKNDDARNEAILLLGHLARECPGVHVVLKDLNKLTSKADVEVDFFENITHLQLHRHARALQKFCTIFRAEEEAPNSKTLTQFILPMASNYFFKDRYANKNSLINFAVETVGVVSKLLPWHQYEGILKYYLGKLRHKVDHQRQLVKLMVVVLDAFHFDLSKGYVENVQPIEQTLIKEEEKVEDSREVSAIEEEQVEEALESIQPADEVEEEDPEETPEKIKAIDRIRVLCLSTATRVIRSIQTVLLPQLQRALAELTQHEGSHKVNRKKTSFEREEEDLSKVPISLALVKLLKRLPKKILDANLPRVFTKLCTFLKSQLESVRRTARETLQGIMLTLGPEYLAILLDQIGPLLSRGYQVHVLVYTLHSVLVCLKDLYKPKDIDKVLFLVLDLCKNDLFGSVSEEKEVVKITRKVSEAKSTKSFDTLQILASYITDSCLMDLLLPFKNILVSSHSYKTVNKSQECLRRIALGLVENNFVPTESLLKFAYGASSESIPQLLVHKEKPQINDKEKEYLEKQKPDCFIIPAAPTNRSGFRNSGVKTSTKTNAHVLVEFGLKLCRFLLKKEKLKEEEHKPFVDPFVSIFKNCLKSRHIKLSSLSLQCLTLILKYDLPSMKENIVEIVESMFEILHKYAAAGLSKGDNFELVMAAFKAMSVVVKDVKYHTISEEQLKILLLYVEQDLHNYERQATAFGLLRAIISRKLVTPEIHEIMQKVADLSITSEQTHVRLQARLVFHQYLMDYPLRKKMVKFVSFYVAQLNYEEQSGRESAIQMIQSIINSFPIKVLARHAGAFVIALGASLINDEEAECRKMVANCLTMLFQRLPRPEVDILFNLIISWFKDKKKTHKQLAAQLCGLLVAVEKQTFESRFSTIIPILLTQFGIGDDQKPGRFVLLKKEKSNEEDNADGRIKDHHLFQVLQLLLKICAYCPDFLKRAEDLRMFSEYIQTLLSYPHEWVRLAAAQFLGFVLSSLDTEKLANLLVNNTSEEMGYLYSNPSHGIKSLTLDLCGQLLPDGVKSELAEQVIKNLIFIARVLQKVPINNSDKINLLWLTKRMRKIVNAEVIEKPSSIILRTEVFKWIAGVGTALEEEAIRAVLYHLLAPLVREMATTEESNATLRQLAKQVGNLLKKRVGMEDYSNLLSKLQQVLSVKRAERKRERNQLAVTNPEVYAQKKIKMHEKKKEAKKRKIQQMKGTGKKIKRRKIVNFDENSEIM